MSIRFAFLLTISLLSSSCLADTMSYQPATYEVILNTPGGVQTQIGNSAVSLQYSSTPTASLPFAAASAHAGPNDLGVYSGIGSISNGPVPGNIVGAAGGDIEANAYATDMLYLTGAPTKGYLSVLISVLGYNLNSTSVGSAPDSESNPESQVAFEIATGAGSNCTASNSTACGSGAAPGIPGLTLLSVPYILAKDGTTLFSTAFFGFDECETAGVATCSAQSLFFDTATINSITVEDTTGNAVSGATVTSLAGINYNSPMQVTPEPSSILLLGTGAMSIAGLISRRHVARNQPQRKLKNGL